MKPTAFLALEDGSLWPGFSCGAEGTSSGELVFNTAMTGYQEVLTDPSYKNQIVVMTSPMIGNYGITARDDESARPFLSGFVVRELCRKPSNWEMAEGLESFLKRSGVVAVEGLDTRALTLRLRDKGALRGVLSTAEKNPARLKKSARLVEPMAGANLVGAVSCRGRYAFNTQPLPQKTPHVVAYDFGVKRGILRALAALRMKVTVLPASTSAAEALKLAPDGIVLSNGPGDPQPLKSAVEAVKRLVDSGKPILGICLGHQILALALGAKTYKLKFGHHGVNHPVLNLRERRVEITAQNHGFAVDPSSLPAEVEITHRSLNDQSCEGFAHRERPILSLQYHPEASAGPHDALKYFERFKSAVAAASVP